MWSALTEEGVANKCVVCVLNHHLWLHVHFSYSGFSHRMEQQQAKVPMDTPQPHSDLTVVRGASHREHQDEDEDEDEYGEDEPVPDLEKDDMMARRTGSFQKSTASIKKFLPVPGSVKCSIAPVSARKQLNGSPKYTEKEDNGRYAACLRETSCCCWN